jgi:hypothetical protein
MSGLGIETGNREGNLLPLIFGITGHRDLRDEDR